MRTVYRLTGVVATIALAFAWGAIQAPQAVHQEAEPISKPWVEQIELNRVTYYHAVPEQTDDDPEVSACGRTRSNQIAVSRDLFRGVLPCGTIVQLHLHDGEFVGEFIVWDTMARRWNATADVLYDVNTKPAWGLSSGTLTVMSRP